MAMEVHRRVAANIEEVCTITADYVVELGPMIHVIGKIAVGYNVLANANCTHWRCRSYCRYDLHIINIDAIADIRPEGEHAGRRGGREGHVAGGMATAPVSSLLVTTRSEALARHDTRAHLQGRIVASIPLA